MADEALSEAEERLQRATARFENMRASHPEFIALGASISKIEREVAELRQREVDAEAGVAELAPKPKSSLTKADIKLLMSAVGRGVAEFVAGEKKALEAKILEQQKRSDSLEKVLDHALTKISAVEERSLRYEGVWAPKISYAKNTLVTDRGSVWISKKATIERPGTDPDSWQLAAKSKDLIK
jgi:hypothetical protein